MDTDPPVIRPYKNSDAGACCEIINACIAEMDGLNEAARQFIARKNNPEALNSELQNYHTLVSISGSQIVALGCLNHGEIKRLYIHPGEHGHGIGTRLLILLEQEARRIGVKQLRTDASPSSVTFYEQTGFQKEKEDEIRKGEAHFRFVKMTKSL